MWHNHRRWISGLAYLVGTLLVVSVAAVLAAPVMAGEHRPAADRPLVPLHRHAANPPGPVTEVLTLTIDGVRRTYHAIVPAQLTGGLPLLIVLHGRGQSEPAVLRQTGFLGLAQQRQAVLVFPDGEQRSCNAGHGCCGFAGSHQAPDVPFVAAIVADAVHRWPIDGQRVYLVGYSNGGKLAYSAVCARPTLFAAVATYGAVPLSPCQPGTPAVSFLLAAGTADQVLLFHGKPAGHPPLPAVSAALAWLRAQDGCSGTAQTSQDGSAVVQRWSRCTGGADVESVVYPGQGHAWPSGGSPAAAPLMWAFLSRHQARTVRPAVGAPVVAPTRTASPS